jgi:TctA family transporter
VAVFFTRPISATLTVIALLSLFAPLWRYLWEKHRTKEKAVA